MTGSAGFVTLDNVKKARAALKDTGVLLIPNGYDLGTCREIVSWIDSYRDEAQAEKNYAGTELRIWDSHKKGPLFEDFRAQCDLFVSCLEAQDTEAYTLLAIRNRSLASGDQQSMVGRWHIDSFRRQLKVFLFPVDVTTETGPFEFIPGTHTPRFKARQLVNGIYFHPKDFLKGSRAYARLNDQWVDRIASNGYTPQPVLCQAGTVMIVDTSSIHRARPCFEGTRYALTAYYR